MDRRGESLAPRSKRVLAQGRRIASHLGATLYAVAAESEDDNDGWIAEAGLAGADKVVLLSFGSRYEGGTRASKAREPGLLAAAMMAVCDALSPNLVLFDRDAVGTAIAPALASHLAAQTMLGVQPHFLSGGDVFLEERTPDRRSWRHVSLTKSVAPVMATISTAGVEPARGDDDADVIFFKAPQSPVDLPATGIVASSSSLDGRVVVCGGLQSLPVFSQVRELASLLKAPLVVTKALASNTSVDGVDVVDLSAHIVAPALYLCLGDDGADSHLSAIALGTQIVSLGAEPRNPAVSASRYAVLGPLSETLPALLHAVATHTASPPKDQSESKAVLPIGAPSMADAFTPCPDAVELFSAPGELLDRLHADRLWVP